MIALLEASEAARGTSTIIFDGAAVMALISVAGLAVREYFKSRQFKKNGDRRKNNDPNNLKPGTAPICIEQGKEIVRLKVEQGNIDEIIKEMKTDIKELLKRIPSRD
jgi:hypothetical protein